MDSSRIGKGSRRREVLLGAVTSVAAATAPAFPARAQEKLTIRLDFSPWGVHAGMHLAQEKGWFRDAGLQVDIQDGRGSGNTLQLVNAGQVDVGQIQLGLLTGARAQGATLKSLAGFCRKTDLCVLVDRNAPISKVADLKGKKIVVFAASPWAPFIDSYLKAGGLDRQSTEILFVDPAALWGTYTSGRADGLMSTVGSAIPVAEGPRPSKALLSSDAGIEFPSYGLVAREEMIKNRGSELRKIVEVQQRAWEHIRNGNVAEGAEAIRKQRPDAKLDPKVLQQQVQLTIDYFDTPATKGKPIGWQAKEDWEAALKSAEQAGIVKAGGNPSDYYTNEFIG
jgi:NitT/TauT family transport system substrate-binding protein